MRRLLFCLTLHSKDIKFLRYTSHGGSQSQFHYISCIILAPLENPFKQRVLRVFLHNGSRFGIYLSTSMGWGMKDVSLPFLCRYGMELMLIRIVRKCKNFRDRHKPSVSIYYVLARHSAEKADFDGVMWGPLR